MGIKKVIGLVCLLCLLCGCEEIYQKTTEEELIERQQKGEKYTPSGRPEMTIKGVTLQMVSSELINEMVNLRKGYNITKQSDNLLVFDYRIKNNARVDFYYGSPANFRVAYTLIRVGDGVRIITDYGIVSNPGTAFERWWSDKEDGNTETLLQIQTFLQRIKQRLEPLEQTVAPKSKKDIQGSAEKESTIDKTSVKEDANSSSKPREEPQFIGVCAQCERYIGRDEKICMSESKLLCPECFRKMSKNH